MQTTIIKVFTRYWLKGTDCQTFRKLSNVKFNVNRGDSASPFGLMAIHIIHSRGTAHSRDTTNMNR